MKIILYKNTSDNRTLDKKLTLIKEVNCELKDENNVISPIIKLKTFSNWKDVNYIYIEDFNRYYYVNVVKNLLGNCVLLNCYVDVLMSNKDDIKNLSCIIDKQEFSNIDKFLDDGSFVNECRVFNSIINFPYGFNDNGEFILITAGKYGEGGNI